MVHWWVLVHSDTQNWPIKKNTKDSGGIAAAASPRERERERRHGQILAVHTKHSQFIHCSEVRWSKFWTKNNTYILIIHTYFVPWTSQRQIREQRVLIAHSTKNTVCFLFFFFFVCPWPDPSFFSKKMDRWMDGWMDDVQTLFGVPITFVHYRQPKICNGQHQNVC
jgi:hypothetical protein